MGDEVANMSSIASLKERYENLDRRIEEGPEPGIDSAILMSFDYEPSRGESEVRIETDEFTAVCPWTGLPDYGTLSITYEPDELCIELKSLKYYLLSYRDVGIVQESAANRILDDLVGACEPRRIEVVLDYKVRGGLHTIVTARYPGEAAPGVSGLTEQLP